MKIREDVMQAHLDITIKEMGYEVNEEERRGIRYYAKRIKDTISKYVTFDDDAIFKDPNWPHLWS